MGLFSWFSRLFKIGEANINSQLDKMEDPVKMTEQGIRDLKKDLNQSLQSLAEVKALAIRTKKELEATQRTAGEYENKAILLLQKAEKGDLNADEADRLASQALAKKEQLATRTQATQKDVKHYDQMVAKMENNVSQLKQQIANWEGELKTLKARSKVSQATAKLNKQIARVDSSKDTLAMLDKMREKVAEQESLAESYQEISDQNTSVDDEINKALGSDTKAIGDSDALKKLKAKMAQGSSGGSSSESADNSSPSAISELDKLKQQLREGKE